jgi:glycine/D-amino acid oxidase-like deaminating enzyme
LISGINGLDKIEKKHGNGIADTLWDLKWRGNDIIYDRVEKYGIECDLKSGFVEVATKPRHLAYLYKYELWDKEKTRTMMGTDAYIGGFACYRDGHLHPLNLCTGEARAARKLGAQIYEQSPVTDIEHGNRPKVKTATGSLEADAVILAGNAYSQLEPKHLSNQPGLPRRQLHHWYRAAVRGISQ